MVNYHEIRSNILKHTEQDDAYMKVTSINEDGELYIECNEDGLKAFTAEMLASLEAFKSEVLVREQNLIPICRDDYYNIEGYRLCYITPIKQSRREIEPTLEYEETWKDRWSGRLIGAIVILFIICAIIGFVQLIMWIF